MNLPEIADHIIDNILQAQENQLTNNIIYTSDGSPSRHEFLFFIKPEITQKDENIRVPAILGLMFERLRHFNFVIKEIRILGASYLEKHNIISQHYGVINAMSSNARENLSPEGKGNFKTIFGKASEDVNLKGSLEFLSQYKEFDPFSLYELWVKSKTVKLAGGTYCASIDVSGEQVFLINGFHPKQLIHFTTPGRSIVAFHLMSDIDWSTARNQFIGKTNPEDAEPGSLRFELLKRKSEFGLDEVSSGKNGFHLSAGPVEGLVELMRYCSDFATGQVKKPGDFLFGRLLLEIFTESEVREICKNRYVIYNGSKISTFDLTEEKNAEDALALLKGSSRVQ